MKISAMIRKLERLEKKHGNIDVMFSDPNSDSVYGINDLSFEESDGSYPEEWDMPEGYKFIKASN